MVRIGCCRLLLPALLLTAGLAHGQAVSTARADPQPRPGVEQQLQELVRSRQDLQQMQQSVQKQMADFDARIAALETELGVAPRKQEIVRIAPPPVAEAESGGSASQKQQEEGPFKQGTGVVLAEGENAGLALGVNGYVRYLNQGGLKEYYTDSFGRTVKLDKRQDIQLNRLQLQFRGWLFDEKFRYTFYAWTQNVSQGDPAQVVVGGNINYTFAEWFRLWAGIFSVPSTRTTAQSFPNWLMIDHRGLADEFFRGSYSQGIQAMGKLPYRFFYNVSLTDNLSILGVSASQLDFGLNTVSGALYWMPTTGEYGPGWGHGDFENHQEVATLFGVHFTRSREDAQSQPKTTGIENSQIRLSDGTVIFQPDAFGTGGQITEATYQMLDLDAGVKYRGWSLDGEYYFRWVNDFDVVGSVPVTELYDHGFQLLASTMLKPQLLQAYVMGSKVFGEYGDPWDLGFGLTYFPFERKQVRVNIEGLYMDRSAIGYTAVPYVVGGTGWVWSVNVGTWF